MAAAQAAKAKKARLEDGPTDVDSLTKKYENYSPMMAEPSTAAASSNSAKSIEGQVLDAVENFTVKRDEENTVSEMLMNEMT